jgi:cytochrome bd-type quinol oxidase subunit 2
MKTLILLLSVAFLGVFGYIFAVNIKDSLDVNYLIFMSLLVILMLICIVISILNFPTIVRNKKRFKSLIYNSYSDVSEMRFDST